MRRLSLIAFIGLAGAGVAAQAAESSRFAALEPALAPLPLADPGCVTASHKMAEYSDQHGLLFLRWGAKRFDTPTGRSTFCVAQMRSPQGGPRYEIQFTLDGSPTGREFTMLEHDE